MAPGTRTRLAAVRFQAHARIDRGGEALLDDVAQEVNVVDAGEELHRTPPAVSIQISLREGHAHADLFERVGRHLRLTQAGEEVLARTREILAQIREAEEAIEGLASLEQGFLDIAVINAGDYFFPWILADFRNRHPRIRVRLSVGNRDELLAPLPAHQIHLPLTSHPPPHPH